MPTKEEALLELERRGALDARQQSALDELRSRGLISSSAVADVRREIDMSEDEYAEADRARIKAGGLSRPQPSTVGLASDRALDVFGVHDEFIGGSLWLGKLLSSGFDVDAADEKYNKAVERIRAERKVAAERLGNYGILADIIGGAGTVAAGKAAATGANALAGWLQGAKSSAKTGAGFGAVAGFGHGEGGIANRALSTGAGALAGGIASPLVSHVTLPAAGKVVSGMRSIPNAVQGLRTRASSNPDAILYRTLQRQDMKPRDAQRHLDTGEDLATYQGTRVDLPETIADTGPAARRLVRAVEASPGQGSSHAETFLNLRQRGSHPVVPKTMANPNYVKGGPKKGEPGYEPQRIPDPDYQPGQYDRVNEQLRRGLKVGKADYHKTDARLIRQQKEDSDPAYALFYNQKNANGDPIEIDVGDILARSEMADVDLSPNLKRMMVEARKQMMDENIARDVGRDMNNQAILGKDAVVGRAPNYKLSPRRFDSGKQTIDDMISDAQNKGHTNRVRLLTELQNELIAEADKVSGRVYAAARDAYGSPARLQDALHKGRTFMKGDSEVTAAEYRALSTAEKRMFRVGMAKQAEVELGRKTLGSDMVRHFDRPNMQKVLAEIMSKPEYLRFAGLNTREARMLSSLRATQGSRTTPTKADVEDLDWMSRQAEGLRQYGLMGFAVNQIAEVVKRLTRMRERDSVVLARMLFEPDRAQQRVILRRLEDTYGTPRVQRSIAAAVRTVRRMKRMENVNLQQRRGVPVLAGEIAGERAAIQ